MNSLNGLHKGARPTWNRSARTTRRGGRTVREALPIHLVIVGQLATGPHCNGFPGRRRSEPARRRWSRCGRDQRIGRGRQRRGGLSAGVWTPSDIAWVPAERRPAAPLVLTDAEATCSSRRSAAALAATTEVVDLSGAGAGAENDGAPRAGKALVCITNAANWRRHAFARVAVTATLRFVGRSNSPTTGTTIGASRLDPWASASMIDIVPQGIPTHCATDRTARRPRWAVSCRPWSPQARNGSP